MCGPINNLLVVSGALQKSAKFTFGKAIGVSPSQFVVKMRRRGGDYEAIQSLCTADLIPHWFWMVVPDFAVEQENEGYVDFEIIAGNDCARVHVDIWPRSRGLSD